VSLKLALVAMFDLQHKESWHDRDAPNRANWWSNFTLASHLQLIINPQAGTAKNNLLS